MMSVLFLLIIAACSTSTTPQPPPTLTGQQVADAAFATAQAEHIAMCNDLLVNHANEVVSMPSPELVVTRNIYEGEKWAVLGMSLNSVASDCGFDFEFRAFFSEIGTGFYSEYRDAVVLFEKLVFRFFFKDGSYQDFKFDAHNNIIIVRINNLAKGNELDRIEVIFGADEALSSPKANITVVNPNPGQFGQNTRLEYMSFGDWWVTPSATPGGYTLNPETTPLPIVPTSTEKYGWLDFLSTSTLMPTQSPTPTASFTPPSQ